MRSIATLYARKARSDGWKHHLEYLADRETLREAGAGWLALTMLSMVFGITFMMGCTIFVIGEGWDQLSNPATDFIFAIACVLLVLSYPLGQRAQRDADDAKTRFREKWGHDSLGDK